MPQLEKYKSRRVSARVLALLTTFYVHHKTPESPESLRALSDDELSAIIDFLRRVENVMLTNIVRELEAYVSDNNRKKVLTFVSRGSAVGSTVGS